MRQLLKSAYRRVPLKRELFSLVRAIHVPHKSVYKHLHFVGPFVVRVDDKSFILKHSGADIENTIFWEGLRSSWEGVSVSLWIELCKRSQLILDVGANSGVYSLVAKALNPTAEVHAFEPVRRIYDQLLSNCAVNNYNITCVEKALSNYDGKAEIYDLPTDHIYSVTVNRNLNPPDVPTIKVEIATTRLDTYLGSLGGTPKIDLIKLDVETHEPEVLEGMGAYLERDRPAMLIEVLNDEVGARIEALVARCGYFYYNISEVGAPRRQKHVTTSDRFNYLFCSEELARELGLDTAIKA